MPPDLVDEIARVTLERDQMKAERRLLDGADEARVGNTIYRVPAWRRHPINRLRIERLRRKRRRRDG